MVQNGAIWLVRRSEVILRLAKVLHRKPWITQDIGVKSPKTIHMWISLWALSVFLLSFVLCFVSSIMLFLTLSCRCSYINSFTMLIYFYWGFKEFT